MSEKISDTVSVLADGTTSVDVRKLLEKSHVRRTFGIVRKAMAMKPKRRSLRMPRAGNSRNVG